MNPTAWIVIIGMIGTALCNAVICAFYFGRLAGRVKSNEENCGKHTTQITDILGTLHSFPYGHGVRITRLETRLDDGRDQEKKQ